MTSNSKFASPVDITIKNVNKNKENDNNKKNDKRKPNNSKRFYRKRKRILKVLDKNFKIS